ncbi:hypothetical protein Tco_0965576 [Tanacetum coccineum]
MHSRFEMAFNGGDEVLFWTTDPHVPKGIFRRDHARECIDTRKSNSGGIQFIGDSLKLDVKKHKLHMLYLQQRSYEYVAFLPVMPQVMWH